MNLNGPEIVLKKKISETDGRKIMNRDIRSREIELVFKIFPLKKTSPR
jgi:hypothetical protein